MTIPDHKIDLEKIDEPTLTRMLVSWVGLTHPMEKPLELIARTAGCEANAVTVYQRHDKGGFRPSQWLKLATKFRFDIYHEWYEIQKTHEIKASKKA